MNFLAHTFLSYDDPALIVGNYLGDFIRNKELKLFPPRVQAGIFLHRKIDTFTDASTDVKRGTRLLHEYMGKYSPVVLDIYFDFLLSKNWSLYSNRSLSSVCGTAYDALLNYHGYMPDHLTDRIYRMCADRWLENYGSYQGLTRVFGYLFRRAKFPSHLDKATIVLEKLEEPLDDIFQTYFPKLETYVQGEIKLI